MRREGIKDDMMTEEDGEGSKLAQNINAILEGMWARAHCLQQHTFWKTPLPTKSKKAIRGPKNG